MFRIGVYGLEFLYAALRVDTVTRASFKSLISTNFRGSVITLWEKLRRCTSYPLLSLVSIANESTCTPSGSGS